MDEDMRDNMAGTVRKIATGKKAEEQARYFSRACDVGDGRVAREDFPSGPARSTRDKEVAAAAMIDLKAKRRRGVKAVRMMSRLKVPVALRQWTLRFNLLVPPFRPRFKRYQAFDAELDQEVLAQARAWFKTFNSTQLPKGNTTYARSSGPGGQHVNKTETKAITAYPVGELISMLPKTLHPGLRKSRYYTANNDSLTFQAQDSRSRNANADDNRRKLAEEVTRMYEEATPAETSEEKKKKHEEMSVPLNSRGHESPLPLIRPCHHC
ncbi:hypothetical protein ACJZ2D_010984 [Fusarium nematophilum]